MTRTAALMLLMFLPALMLEGQDFNHRVLPEVVVSSRHHKVLHQMAYVREYSTLTTYSDTVTLFREKLVDFMLTPDKRVKFQGWTEPRMLKSRSYYRFTNAAGLDSVSDVGNNHFSWSDWIGVNPVMQMPKSIAGQECATDTIYGKYSPTEIWVKDESRLSVEIDVLADTLSRKWVPTLAGFFRKELDFERFKLCYEFDNVASDTAAPDDLRRFSYEIESCGRGRDMFRFHHSGESYFVTTHAEVYIIDQKFITVKEAKKWAKLDINALELDITEPTDAPPLSAETLALIDRVNGIDHDEIRLAVVPDPNLGSGRLINKNYSLGNRLLFILKALTGISYYKSHKKQTENWRELKKRIRQKNHTSE